MFVFLTGKIATFFVFFANKFMKELELINVSRRDVVASNLKHNTFG